MSVAWQVLLGLSCGLPEDHCRTSGLSQQRLFVPLSKSAFLNLNNFKKYGIQLPTSFQSTKPLEVAEIKKPWPQWLETILLQKENLISWFWKGGVEILCPSSEERKILPKNLSRNKNTSLFHNRSMFSLSPSGLGCLRLPSVTLRLLAVSKSWPQFFRKSLESSPIPALTNFWLTVRLEGKSLHSPFKGIVVFPFSKWVMVPTKGNHPASSHSPKKAWVVTRRGGNHSNKAKAKSVQKFICVLQRKFWLCVAYIPQKGDGVA